MEQKFSGLEEPGTRVFLEERLQTRNFHIFDELDEIHSHATHIVLFVTCVFRKCRVPYLSVAYLSAFDNSHGTVEANSC